MRTLSTYLEKPLYKDKKRIKRITEKNKHLNFVDRALNPEKYPALTDERGNEMTHLLRAEVDEKGQWYVFPEIVYDKSTRKLKTLSPDQAWKYAEQTGERIPFGKKKKLAIKYSQNGLIDHSQDADDSFVKSSALSGKLTEIPSDEEVTLERARRYYMNAGIPDKSSKRSKDVQKYLETGKWPQKEKTIKEIEYQKQERIQKYLEKGLPKKR